MKYIYLVNRFIYKEKTEMLINCLDEVSRQFNRDYEIVINDDLKSAKENARKFKDNQYIITSIGGDGAINLLLNDIVHTNNILSYIPMGTGNDFYRSNLDDLKDGIHDVDVVKINDYYYINIACFGMDADIANDDRFIHNKYIPKSMRYNVGLVYYYFTYKPKNLSVIINDQTIKQDITSVVVANAKYYGGGYHVAPNSKIDDGLLEVYVVDKLNKLQMADIILSIQSGKHLKNPALKSFTAKKLSILSDQPINANMDGEDILADRFDIEIIPKAIKLDINFNFINEIHKKIK